MKITKVGFGFPELKSVTIFLEEVEELKNNDFTGKNVLVKIKIDKMLRKNFNQQELVESIKKSTNANFIKLQFEYDNENNVRAKSVAEKKDITDKFVEYAKINDIKYHPTVLTKIKDIQETISMEQQIPTEAFSLEFLSLRGAVGVKKGTGKDEIQINFKDYNDGLIVLLGNTGMGKTTIIENCHPYPCMLSRKGSLKDHFCLKDSHRILIYKTDSGKRYKIGMYISGTAISVMTRYEVDIEDNGQWTRLNYINSYDSYKMFVEQTFGTMDIFLRTAFYIKENIKDLPDLAFTTKTENINLFSILAGTDYLSEISLVAKQRLKESQEKVVNIKSQMQNFDTMNEQIEEYKEGLEKSSTELIKVKSLIEIDKEELEIYTEEQRKFDASVAQYDIVRKALSEALIEIENLEHKLKKLTNEKDMLESIDVKEKQEQEEWYEKNMILRKKIVNEKNEKEVLLLELKAKIDTEQSSIVRFNKELSTFENKIYRLESDINLCNSKIPDNTETCPVCNAPLEEKKKAELIKIANDCQKEIDDKNNEIKTINKEIVIFKNKKEDSENKIKSLKEEYDVLNSELLEISNNIVTIDNYAEMIDIVQVKDFLKNGVKRLEEVILEITTCNQKLQEKKQQVSEYEKIINDNVPDYSEKIKRLTRNIQNSHQEVATLSAKIDFYHSQLEKFKEYMKNIEEIKDEYKIHKIDIADYEVIAKAFGNTGIQILELESAVPEISSVANEILHETYGDRFTLMFDTQKNTKDGKVIDDFVINIFDSKDGSVEKLDMLSSGERVWVKQALYYAFSVIRARRTGFCFKTRFLDETDGSLDSDARLKYLKMIESAHDLCNATQTILITHSKEIKDLVIQKIELTA